MTSSKERKLLGILALVGLGWAVFVSIYTSILAQTDPRIQRLMNPTFDWGPALTTYDVVSISPNFTEQWRISDIFVDPTLSGNSLLALEDSLFFVGSTNQGDFPALQKLNLQTGQHEWHDQPIRNFSLLVSGSNQNVIVGHGIPSEITIYDARSGDIMVERTFSFRTRGMDFILAEGGELYVNNDYHFYLLDEGNGKTKPFRNPNKAYPIFLIQNGVIYHRELGNSLQALDEQTGRMIWGRGFDKEILHQPMFTEETIFVRTGKSTGQVHVLDRLTGETLWVSEPGVVSNVATVGDWVYYLTEEAHLHVADLQTGMLIDDIVFSPAILDLTNIEQVNSYFYVAATEDMTVVYFSSSHQLFAFQHIPEE
ncbi:MAG TPA: PQQ-binding-like beta-propeller repeat protein [Chloroflexota bacterium]|nr:PQQ-binding-like beta-propeller repeat protein [Chloroflexota bacterium]HUM69250.1 PQQ-binding-like beta-propeller repeat protein [Chloroflexota bacterium]